MKYSDKKILYIDDNKMMLKIVKKQLEPYGFALITLVETPEEVMTALETNEYDLLIFDDMLQVGKFGTDLMQELKSNPNFKTPIVVLTGNSEYANPREHYMSVGFDEYLGKPLEPSALEHILTMFLG